MHEISETNGFCIELLASVATVIIRDQMVLESNGY